MLLPIAAHTTQIAHKTMPAAPALAIPAASNTGIVPPWLLNTEEAQPVKAVKLIKV